MNISLKATSHKIALLFQQDLMYKEPAKWAMPFQTYVVLTMLQTHTAPTEKRIKLMERSIFSARYVYFGYLYKL